MSSEANNKISFGSCLLFPSLQAGFGTLNSIRRNKGLVAAYDSTKVGEFAKLNKKMKEAGIDCFTRSRVSASTYESYKEVFETARKANSAYAKALKNKNINKAKLNDLKKAANDASDALKKAEKGIASIGKEVLENGATSTLKGLKNGIKSNFAKEMSFKFGWLNYAFAGMSLIGSLTNEVIPAFKEKGILAGFKETAEAIASAGSDFLASAMGGSIGRAVGGFLGNIVFPGVGAVVGGMIGDMALSSLAATKAANTVDKVFGDDEAQETIASNQDEYLPNQYQQYPQQQYSYQQDNNFTDFSEYQELTQEQRAKIQQLIAQGHQRIAQQGVNNIASYYA